MSVVASSLIAMTLVAGSLADNRQIGFTTQDSNGFHLITAIEYEDKAMAAVYLKVPGQETSRRETDYSQEAFERHWDAVQSATFKRYQREGGLKDLGVSVNYVIVLRRGKTEIATYLIPKCGVEPEVKVVIDNIAMNLLPEGSPGLFKPCEAEG